MLEDALVAAGLFGLLLVSLEAGFRAGRRAALAGDAAASGQVGAIQGAVLGLLGLLLAFSFAAAGARFLERQDLIVQEANAIGTASLRADLLDEAQRAELRAALKSYTEHRIELSTRLRGGVDPPALAEIERRGLVPGPPQWTRLLREARGEDRIAVARAAAAHPSPPVTQELLALLAGPDDELVAAAAISLGVPGNEKAVEPLGGLLASDQERVRMAALRGLGRIGTPAAKARLAKAAASHPDPDMRRRARAEASR